MGHATDRLRKNIEEFHEVELMPPSWVKLHPDMWADLQIEIGPRLDLTESQDKIMGLEMRVDASMAADYMQVGRD
ncbi:hypothetical protein [Vreelandella populi]|uniref:Uncharacterized protein n=1 Tax=Vreelandella populi TaxID=2498858 RepID=A0A3S1E9P8_9GAMM|nr:hypothetical protein [Halomonas populi]RUR48777.1 hypothetical protein ELY37_02705 [Halomonas populi]